MSNLYSLYWYKRVPYTTLTEYLPCVFIVLIDLNFPTVRYVTVVTPHCKHWRVGPRAGWQGEEKHKITLTRPQTPLFYLTGCWEVTVQFQSSATENLAFKKGQVTECLEFNTGLPEWWTLPNVVNVTYLTNCCLF